MLPAPCPQRRARRGWRSPPSGRGTAAKAHLLPELGLRGGHGLGMRAKPAASEKE